MPRAAPGAHMRGEAAIFDQAALRQMPAVLIVDTADRVIMSTEQSRTMLRELDPEHRTRTDFVELPRALRSVLAELRQQRPDDAGVTPLGGDLCVRTCRLSSAFGTYLLVSFERVKRSNAIPLNLARYHFTPREFQAAVFVIEGLSNRAIASKLCVSKSTVDGYLKHIYNKVDVHSRAALVTKLLGLS